jgi:hypothetical protein
MLGSIGETRKVIYFRELDYATERSHSGREQSDERRTYVRIWINQNQAFQVRMAYRSHTDDRGEEDLSKTIGFP